MMAKGGELSKHTGGSSSRGLTRLNRLDNLVRNRTIPVILPNGRKEGKKEMFYLTTHSTHFIYGYMASDIW